MGPFRHQDALSTVTLTITLYFLSVGFSLLDILYKWKLALCSLRLASFTWCSIFLKKSFQSFVNLSSNLSRVFTVMSRMGCLEESQSS